MSTSTPPIINYTFDVDGTNSGSGGAVDNAIIQSAIHADADISTVDTVTKLTGAGSIAIGTMSHYGDSVPRFSFNTGTAWSISFWARHNTGTSVDRMLFSMYDSDSHGVHSGTGTPGYTQRVQLSTTGTTVDWRYQNSDLISVNKNNHDGKWHHYVIACSANNTSNSITIYDDNVLIITSTTNQPDNTNMQCYIGGTYFATLDIYEQSINGNIDNFRVYDFGIDSTFVDYLYNLDVAVPIIYTSVNGGFTYTITNDTDYVMEAADYSIIQSAFDKWDNMISVDSRFGDSHTINVTFVIDSLDVGVLGGASIQTIHYIDSQTFGNVLPHEANLTMNKLYLSGLKTTVRDSGNTGYYSVLLHEIGHILGIGTLWYLTDTPKTSYVDTDGDTKYYYTGANALREYKAYLTEHIRSGIVGIPIEDDGGGGTAGGHPEEGTEGALTANDRYINGMFHPGLDTELMTGWLDSAPVSTPLSRITLGFLEDLGYTVNYDFADSYIIEYNLADLYTMSWLATTDANNLEQTYIKSTKKIC
jgi:hypothetical protein